MRRLASSVPIVLSVSIAYALIPDDIEVWKKFAIVTLPVVGTSLSAAIRFWEDLK